MIIMMRKQLLKGQKSTVIANDYYDHFAAALQKDFNDNMHYDKNEVTAEILISTLKTSGRRAQRRLRFVMATMSHMKMNIENVLLKENLKKYIQDYVKIL